MLKWLFTVIREIHKHSIKPTDIGRLQTAADI